MSMVGAAFFGAALLVGCGGSASGGSTEAPEPAAELSHAEWVSAADEVCEEDHEENAGREEEFGELIQTGKLTPATRAAAASLIRGAIPVVEKEAPASPN